MSGGAGVPGRRAEILDISRPLSPGVPVWPGDRPLRLEQEIEGSSVLSWFSTTCHVGSHLDAPRHIDPAAGAVDAIPLDRLVGPAEVVATSGPLVTPASLPVGWSPSAPRLLLKTDSHPLGAPIGPEFAALGSDLVSWLADRGVVLVGIDTPSVDPFESDSLPAHHTLAARGMTWLEGLWLEHIPDGIYTLVALPLPLLGAEAAPVRAILLREAVGQWTPRPAV